MTMNSLKYAYTIDLTVKNTIITGNTYTFTFTITEGSVFSICAKKTVDAQIIWKIDTILEKIS